MSPAFTRSAVKLDRFANQALNRKIDQTGDPLQLTSRHIDFVHLGRFIDEVFSRKTSAKGGCPPYPTEQPNFVCGPSA